MFKNCLCLKIVRINIVSFYFVISVSVFFYVILLSSCISFIFYFYFYFSFLFYLLFSSFVLGLLGPLLIGPILSPIYKPIQPLQQPNSSPNQAQQIRPAWPNEHQASLRPSTPTSLPSLSTYQPQPTSPAWFPSSMHVPSLFASPATSLLANTSRTAPINCCSSCFLPFPMQLLPSITPGKSLSFHAITSYTCQCSFSTQASVRPMLYTVRPSSDDPCSATCSALHASSALAHYAAPKLPSHTTLFMHQNLSHTSRHTSLLLHAIEQQLYPSTPAQLSM